MRYETPIFLGVVTVAAAFLDMLLFVPPAHCQQQVPIQSPAAHTQPVARSASQAIRSFAFTAASDGRDTDETRRIETRPEELRSLDGGDGGLSGIFDDARPA